MSDLRAEEAVSIRDFVMMAAEGGYLSGRVLDYGCGKQPYRDIVEVVGGEYVGYDHASFPAHVGDVSVGTDPLYEADDPFDTILCTQVVQYVPIYRDEGVTPDNSLRALLDHWQFALRKGEYGTEPGGYLVLTYPTNWPEVEPEDLHRFTKAGMERLLTEAGFTIIRHDFRHGFQHEGVSFACGYGVIARA